MICRQPVAKVTAPVVWRLDDTEKPASIEEGLPVCQLTTTATAAIKTVTFDSDDDDDDVVVGGDSVSTARNHGNHPNNISNLVVT